MLQHGNTTGKLTIWAGYGPHKIGVNGPESTTTWLHNSTLHFIICPTLIFFAEEINLKKTQFKLNFDVMWKKASLIVLGFLIFSPLVKAQSGDDGKGVVMYDPLFWRSELRIKAGQAQKIEEINRDYYDQLLTAYHTQPDNDNYLSGAVVQNTRIRNQRILDTFAPHQRRKWEKIQVAYSN